jgi:Mn-dependent DtxR family transcriptional regulator
MSEARLLWLVLRYPHPTALARRVRDGRVFAGLRRLEACGLVTRRRGEYRLTRRGRDELAMTHALTRMLARTHSAFL